MKRKRVVAGTEATQMDKQTLGEGVLPVSDAVESIGTQKMQLRGC